MSHTQEATGDPFLDEEWLATKGPRSRWRIALWAALAVAVVFLAGAQVQKHFGTPSTTSPAAQGFPTGQGIPSGFPQLGSLPQASSAPSSSAKQSASLIGTVTRVKGNTLRVKDFGGATHTIRIGTHTSITTLTTLRPRDIKPGSTVVIKQGPGSSKHRPATAITVR